MRSLIYIVLGTVSLLPIVSCNQNKGNADRSNQRELFLQSVSLLENKIKQIGNAKDSTAVDSIYKSYEEELTALNFKFPPETDFKMTESENDTLINLLTRVHTLRDSLLISFARNQSVPADSIAVADTVN